MKLDPNASHPKLKQARAEIEAILKKHDIGGWCILHAPSHAELFMDINPSYSKLQGTFPVIRVHSKLEDYGGDQQAQIADLSATVNMINMMSEGLA